MSRDSIAETLLLVHDVLERNDIWHCLHFGTLLGAVRDGDVIEWDHDLDLLVRRADIPAILALNEQLAREELWFWSGYTVASGLAMNPGSLTHFDAGYLSIMRGDGSRGELYAPTLFADGVLRLYDLEREAYHWPQSSFPSWFVEETDEVELRGARFRIPRRADVLLRFLYGDDWRTPIRSVRDGGEWQEGRTAHGDVAAPNLEEQVAWCEAQGWDRPTAAGLPAWPRRIRGAGPPSWSPRTELTSGSCWWHDLDELAASY